MSFLNALGQGLQGLDQGVNQGIRLGQQQQQIARQNAMQNLQLQQQLAPGMIANNPQAAAQALAATQAQLKAAGFNVPQTPVVGAPQTVQGPIAPGQFGPGAPVQTRNFNNPQTQQALMAGFGVMPTPQVIKGSWGTPSSAVIYNPISHQMETIWQGPESPRNASDQANAQYLQAKAYATLHPQATPYQAQELGLREQELALMGKRLGQQQGQAEYTPMPTADGSIVLVNRRTGAIMPTQYKAPPKAGGFNPFAAPGAPASPAPAGPAPSAAGIPAPGNPLAPYATPIPGLPAPQAPVMNGGPANLKAQAAAQAFAAKHGLKLH